MSERRTLRARLAAESRYRPDEDHSHLRRDYAAVKIEEYVAKVVAEAPPLTAEQRHRIAQLLAPHATVGGGDAA